MEVIKLSICRRFYRENQHSSVIAIPYEHTHVIRWIFDHLLPKCHGNAFKCYQWKYRIKATTAGKFKINSRYYYYCIVSLIIRVNKSSVIYVIYIWGMHSSKIQIYYGYQHMLVGLQCSVYRVQYHSKWMTESYSYDIYCTLHLQRGVVLTGSLYIPSGTIIFRNLQDIWRSVSVSEIA